MVMGIKWSHLFVFVGVFGILFAGWLKAEAQGDSLSAHPTQVGPGQTVSVDYVNSSPTTNDWISMHPVSAPDSSWINWQHANAASGTLNFQAPQNPGNYEFRFFKNGPTKSVISNSFTVIIQQQSQPTMQLTLTTLSRDGDANEEIL